MKDQGSTEAFNRLKISYVVCESLTKLVNLEMALSPVADILYS